MFSIISIKYHPNQDINGIKLRNKNSKPQKRSLRYTVCIKMIQDKFLTFLKKSLDESIIRVYIVLMFR
jgi:hypothetical protein